MSNLIASFIKKNVTRVFATAVLVTTLLLPSSLLAAAAATDSTGLIGYWRTYDEKTNKPAGIVQINFSKGAYHGKLVKIFSAAGKKPSDLCVKCSGKLHNKTYIGHDYTLGF